MSLFALAWYPLGGLAYFAVLGLLVYGFGFDTRPTLRGDWSAFFLSSLVWPLSLVALALAVGTSLRRSRASGGWRPR